MRHRSRRWGTCWIWTRYRSDTAQHKHTVRSSVHTYAHVNLVLLSEAAPYQKPVRDGRSNSLSCSMPYPRHRVTIRERMPPQALNTTSDRRPCDFVIMGMTPWQKQHHRWPQSRPTVKPPLCSSACCQKAFATCVIVDCKSHCFARHACSPINLLPTPSPGMHYLTVACVAICRVREHER